RKSGRRQFCRGSGELGLSRNNSVPDGAAAIGVDVLEPDFLVHFNEFPTRVQENTTPLVF
ncbi:MAG: hypothetical protein ACKOE0_07180, partial [Actinomycetes bacterium]